MQLRPIQQQMLLLRTTHHFPQNNRHNQTNNLARPRQTNTPTKLNSLHSHQTTTHPRIRPTKLQHKQGRRLTRLQQTKLSMPTTTLQTNRTNPNTIKRHHTNRRTPTIRPTTTPTIPIPTILTTNSLPHSPTRKPKRHSRPQQSHHHNTIIHKHTLTNTQLTNNSHKHRHNHPNNRRPIPTNPRQQLPQPNIQPSQHRPPTRTNTMQRHRQQLIKYQPKNRPTRIKRPITSPRQLYTNRRQQETKPHQRPSNTNPTNTTQMHQHARHTTRLRLLQAPHNHQSRRLIRSTNPNRHSNNTTTTTNTKTTTTIHILQQINTTNRRHHTKHPNHLHPQKTKHRNITRTPHRRPKSPTPPINNTTKHPPIGRI